MFQKLKSRSEMNEIHILDKVGYVQFDINF